MDSTATLETEACSDAALLEADLFHLATLVVDGGWASAAAIGGVVGVVGGADVVVAAGPPLVAEVIFVDAGSTASGVVVFPPHFLAFTGADTSTGANSTFISVEAAMAFSATFVVLVDHFFFLVAKALCSSVAMAILVVVVTGAVGGISTSATTCSGTFFGFTHGNFLGAGCRDASIFQPTFLAFGAFSGCSSASGSSVGFDSATGAGSVSAGSGKAGSDAAASADGAASGAGDAFFDGI